MDLQSNQFNNDERKDHPQSLKEQNLQDFLKLQQQINLKQCTVNLKNKDHITILQGDITNMSEEYDAIVNSANEGLLGGGGVDEAIHKKAGPELAQWIKQNISQNNQGVRCNVGDAVITKSFNLNAKYIIHTVGPYLDEFQNTQPQYLKKCYQNCMKIASKERLNKIAFPCISTGFYGFPMVDAAKIALNTIDQQLNELKIQQQHIPKMVTFVIFNDLEFKIYQTLYQNSEIQK